MPENPEAQTPIQELVSQMRGQADAIGGFHSLDKHNAQTISCLERGANAVEWLVSIVESLKALIDPAMSVVELADRKGCLFVTDPETKSDKLVGHFVPTHTIRDLSNALKQAREAI